ncbi:hypothetical protein VNO77_44328 [Canavalia gladiata]|uniref:Uncharacterized protein n=1 Tax=Canavalia gladiata TaxID=3824 RepID=A0AAN9JVQ7_CANGL
MTTERRESHALGGDVYQSDLLAYFRIKRKTQDTMRRRRQEEEQSRALYELSALVLNLIRSPPTPLTFSDDVPAVPSRRSAQGQISPAGFASLLLGISVALMLCGSVTFFIGFMLMPWVLGLVMVFYVAGIVSTLSVLGRSILCYATAPPTPRKDIPVLNIAYVIEGEGKYDLTPENRGIFLNRMVSVSIFSS